MAFRAGGGGEQVGFGAPGGGNLSHFEGVDYQAGYGLFSAIGNAFRSIAPALRRTASRVMSSDAVKNVGDKLASHGSEIAVNALADAVSGQNVKEPAKQRLAEAREDIAKTIRKGMSRKKKKKKAAESDSSGDDYGDSDGDDKRPLLKKRTKRDAKPAVKRGGRKRPAVPAFDLVTNLYKTKKKRAK